MSEEEQAFLRSLVEDFTALLETCEQDMARRFDSQMLDFDEGNDLWAMFPPHVRTAITRGRKKLPGICTSCGGMGTHTRHCVTGGRFAK